MPGMKASRLLAILISLQGGRRVTAATLADRFEVSKRTIYRDLDELSAAGVPIRADRGVGGGIGLDGRYRTDLTGLSDAEAAAFVFAGLPELASQLGLAAEAQAARVKLIAALGDAGAAGLGNRFHIDPSDWYDRVAAPASLRIVALAIVQGAALRISYASWRKHSRREVEPLGLIVKAGQWYMLARRNHRIAIYRLAAISEVEPSGRRFAIPVDFDLVSEWRTRIAAFEASLQRQSARIRVWPGADDRLYRLGAAIRDRVQSALREADGTRIATVPIESIDHAAGQLLEFADLIEVLDPPALRAAIADRARDVIALYAAPQAQSRR